MSNNQIYINLGEVDHFNENEENIIDRTLSNLNDSANFIESINIDAFDESDLSDVTIDYYIPSESPDTESTDEDIPLSFISKKSKYLKKKKVVNDYVSTLENDNTVDVNTNESLILNKRGRKRFRDERKWKRNVAKTRRNEGKSYFNKFGREVRQREMLKACGLNCHFKCNTKISETDRTKIFHNFWQTGSLNKQRQFLVKYCEKNRAKRANASERNFSYRYYLPTALGPMRVCKLFFLNTLAISQSRVYTAHKKYETGLPGVVADEKRGTSSSCRWNMTSTVNLDVVRQHIKSFPTVESHYCRKNTSKLYLQAGLSVVKLYELYCLHCTKEGLEKVSIQVYRKVFKTEFNFGFHKPRGDQCDLCNAFKNACTKDKKNMQGEYDKHIRNKSLAREFKDNDKNKAKSENDLVVACFDLEEVLITPKGFESALYYKRRLNTYNFTIYSLGDSEVHAYLWNETVASRGASEIASAVYSYIKQKSEHGYRRFVFYSDNCSAQNKNKFYLTMIWYCIQKFNLISISHRYLEKGHTFNENDSVHAAIETASRHISVYTTQQWAAVIRTSRPKKPYIVHELSLEDFYDFKHLSTVLKNFDLDDERNKVYISEIKYFEIRLDDPNRYFFKYDHGSDSFQSVNFLIRLRRSIDLPPDPKCLGLVQLRPELVPLSEEKYNDLISLCLSGVIPKPNHAFYALLPHKI